MNDIKEIKLINEEYLYLKAIYDRLNKLQSSTESAPILFPEINKKDSAIEK